MDCRNLVWFQVSIKIRHARGYMSVIWNVTEVQRNRFHLIAEDWMASLTPCHPPAQLWWLPLSNGSVIFMNRGRAASLNVIFQWSVCSMASFITNTSIPTPRITHPSGRCHSLSFWWSDSLYITKKDYIRADWWKCGWEYSTRTGHLVSCIACSQVQQRSSGKAIVKHGSWDRSKEMQFECYLWRQLWM